jgi:hypothetical protein
MALRSAAPLRILLVLRGRDPAEIILPRHLVERAFTGGVMISA